MKFPSCESSHLSVKSGLPSAVSLSVHRAPIGPDAAYVDNIPYPALQVTMFSLELVSPQVYGCVLGLLTIYLFTGEPQHCGEQVET